MGLCFLGVGGGGLLPPFCPGVPDMFFERFWVSFASGPGSVFARFFVQPLTVHIDIVGNYKIVTACLWPGFFSGSLPKSAWTWVLAFVILFLK